MLSATEICTKYNVIDPVYKGLISWRIEMMEHFGKTFLKDKVHQVLEIGTGNYPFTLALGEECKKIIEFVGIEPDALQAESARAHLTSALPKAEVVQEMFSRKLITKHNWEGRFDFISSFEVYEHIPKEVRFSENCFSALAPGGHLLIETPNKNLTPLLTKVLGAPPNGGGDYAGSEHVNEVGFHELFTDLRSAGFDIIDFDCFYLPLPLWCDGSLSSREQEQLYRLIHVAAKEFPFYAYVQAILARKPESTTTATVIKFVESKPHPLIATIAPEISPRVINQEKLKLSNVIRLNLGCGHKPILEYLNVDMRELPNVDIVAASHYLPFSSESVDEIYSSHLIEHFPKDYFINELLPYWFSLLKEGGVFHGILPDLEAMLSAFKSGEISYEVLKEVTFGTQEYRGDFHFALYGVEEFKNLLHQVGFKSVEYNATARRNGLCYEMDIMAVR
jgi:predicted SAM-dependent methyltransferase